MFTAETVIGGFITLILMLIAYKLPHIRWFHKSTMALVMLFDLAMPFYLYMNRDWKERLIDGGEILNFLIWMHIGLVVTLYILYFMQIKAGKALAKGDEEQRENHRNQGRGILLTRTLVLLTGALLYEPPE
ncbi:MAG: hypothetical protein OEZ58_03170 [Gammaproteobacteria bacterium]|nr:hypothetical protein [Gammaproteobacteria bacterium]MDH5727963.1 hypothetical protein [Gammaproteobacteria bacterium]